MEWTGGAVVGGGGVDSSFPFALFVLFGVCDGTWDKACGWVHRFVRWYYDRLHNFRGG